MFLKTSNLFSDSRKNNSLSIIGEGIELSGEINTEGNIHIDGSMSGIIRANEIVIGPNGNFSEVSDLSKWILSFAMLLGRLEIFAVLVLFLPSFWRS